MKVALIDVTLTAGGYVMAAAVFDQASDSRAAQ